MTRSEFVVTEHNAKRAGLHWDLRFQMPNSNMWASFAVRKGVPLKEGQKVLAVRTHDHKRDEALLTGKIDSGYGAGTFKEWDRGACEIIKYSPAHMSINFKGKKVNGVYHLINVAVTKNTKYKEEHYFLFKGKSIEEMMGMAGRVPSGGVMVDTEEGPSEEPGTKLPWSLSEGVNMAKDYAVIGKYTHMTGFFKKRPKAEYLIVVLKESSKNGILILQFFDKMGDFYLVGLIGSSQSPDDDVLEEIVDRIRHDGNTEILEDEIPAKMKASAKGIEITFTKPSKYIGKTLLLQIDDRLPRGYFLAKCKIKQGFEPTQQFSKMGADALELGDAKKMRAFSSSRMNAIMSKRK